MFTSQADRSCYLACGCVYTVLASFEYLFEDVDFSDVRPHFEQWRAEYNQLINWTVEEYFAVDDGSSKQELEAMCLASQKLHFELVSHWSNQIIVGANTIRGIVPRMSEVMSLYYVYLAWLGKILIEFQLVMEDPINRNSQFYPRYEDHSAAVRSLMWLVQRELSGLALLADMEMSKVELINLTLTTIGEQLAREWREVVDSAASAQQY